MDKEQIKKFIREELKKQPIVGGFNVGYHAHIGSDSPQIDPVNLLGFPTIQSANAAVAPTDTPQNGTFRFYYDGALFYLWAFINNTWTSVQLT